MKYCIGNSYNSFLHFTASSQVPLWLLSAVWVNPVRVTTVMAPMHRRAERGVNTLRPAGSMQILTTWLAGTRTCVCITPDNNPRTKSWCREFMSKEIIPVDGHKVLSTPQFRLSSVSAPSSRSSHGMMFIAGNRFNSA